MNSNNKMSHKQEDVNEYPGNVKCRWDDQNKKIVLME